MLCCGCGRHCFATPGGLLIELRTKTLARYAHGDQKGSVILEAVIAVAILAFVLVAAARALSAGSIGVNTVNNHTTAQNLARSQLAYAQGETYCAPPCSYPTIVPPTGYTITASATSFLGADTHLEYVTVTVSRDGGSVVQITGIKVNR